MPEAAVIAGKHAVVIGGSMAGLLAARVLADHFERVTIVERDQLPADPQPRKGVPQARHIHLLLWRGQQLLEKLFPGLQDDLEQAGAPGMDWINDMRSYVFTGWNLRFPSPYQTHPCSRDFLEWAVRLRVAALPNLHLLQRAEVSELLADEARRRITGVRLNRRDQRPAELEDLPADLVVDASGRQSRVVSWLADLGYPAPMETRINSFLGYATRVYQAPPGWSEWKSHLVRGMPPADKRGGMIHANEHGRWIVTLAGAARDYPPTDEAGFMEFARSLAQPSLYEALRQAQPLTPVTGYRRTENLWRHFEKLRRWPANFVVTGDAVCGFNPVYGQGMTVAAMSADLLDECLQASFTKGDPGHLGLGFQKRLARLIKTPWLLATGDDFRYAETEGGRPTALTRTIHAYVDRVIYAMQQDPDIFRTFFEVTNLVQPLGRLFAAHIVARVLGNGTPQAPANTPAVVS
jgi:2-polyprenyl-6-methoxyphenol hydroxylase-like FAD-dependent oxidoreductase